MRLQVAIHRHALPVVNLIFNTSSPSVSSNAEPVITISDLLAALNVLVPLESSDGEWGLEEYTVQVASARASNDRTYECLHFQHVSDVFKEDDEVVVRGMTSDELRERRRGGRLQITKDGRRLHDGVAWGKRFRVGAGGWRPDVVIPPRKRRRLLVPEEEDLDEDQELRGEEWPELEYPSDTSRRQVSFVGDNNEDDDDEDDDDYSDEVDGQEDDDSNLAVGDDEGEFLEESGAEDEGSTQGEEHFRQLITRATFDDDDTHSEASSRQDDEADEDLDEDEIQLLLEEAGRLERLGSFEARAWMRSRKRKRNDESQHAASKATREAVLSTRSGKINGVTKKARLGPYPVETNSNGTVKPPDRSQPALKSDSGSDTSSSESHVGSEESNTSDDTSDAEDDSDSTSSSGSSSDSDSSPGSESGSDTATTSDESDDRIALDKPKVNGMQHKSVSGQNEKKFSINGIADASTSKPPGTGTVRTKKNNDRVRRRKRLHNLKAQGILPAEADFDDLRQYDVNNVTTENGGDESRNSPGEDVAEEEDSIFVNPQKMAERNARLEEKRKELLARINGSLVEDVVEDMATTQQSSMVPLQEKNNIHQAAALSTEEKEQSQKRARLDVASSRRLLFHSLGLRNPKTQAAEDALREKLTQSAWEVEKRHRKPTQEVSEPAVVNQTVDDSWRKKLVISAVECVQEGVFLNPPPFPFTQNWDKYPTADEDSIRNNDFIELNYDDEDGGNDSQIENVTEVQQNEQPDQTEVRPLRGPTVKAHEDLPYPSDIKALRALKQDDINLNTVIAYKELHLNSKFEPQESSYRVARVIGREEDTVQVTLSKRDLREISSSGQYNNEGQRVFHGFELPNDDEEADDGYREYQFSDLIDPRLVQPGDIRVPATTTDSKELEKDHQELEVVPESGPGELPGGRVRDRQVEVDPTREREISNIIKDAGFNSALDEQLLQPIANRPTRSSGDDVSSNARQSFPLNYAPGKSPIVSDDWASSSLESENSVLIPTSQAGGGEETTFMYETSPPTVSMIETVEYPHMSQIQLSQSRLSPDVTSSSHQDAQRITIQDAQPSNISHSQIKSSGREDTQNSDDQLSRSEVAQTQFQSPPRLEVPSSPTSETFLTLHDGEGQTEISRAPRAAFIKMSSSIAAKRDDGAAAPAAEDTDSDGLPSLRALTSSQKYRALSGTSKPISPPAMSKSASSTRGLHGESRTRAQAHAHAQTHIKLSQQPPVRLSQIPTAQDDDSVDASSEAENRLEGKTAAIIDLTFSSDPAGPRSPVRPNDDNNDNTSHVANDDDEEEEEEEEEEKEEGDEEAVDNETRTADQHDTSSFLNDSPSASTRSSSQRAAKKLLESPSVSMTTATTTKTVKTTKATTAAKPKTASPNVKMNSQAAKMMRSALAGLGGRPRQQQQQKRSRGKTGSGSKGSAAAGTGRKRSVV